VENKTKTMKKNKSILLFSITLLAISCSTTQKESINETKEKQVTVTTDFSNPSFIDEHMEDITFGDSSNVIINYGDLESQILESDNFPPQVGITNTTQNEYIVLSKWYGDGRNEFKYCNVSNSRDDFRKDLFFANSKHEIFTTGKGVKLGISKNELLKNLGADYSKVNLENYEVIKYKDTEILYESNYYFISDKLVKFDFGYLYP
jgi:hypothetical protein